MENRDFFLARLESSLAQQTYKNYELVITEEGKMAENTNAAIKQATGDIVKIIYMDDYFYSLDALKHIAEGFTGGWMVSGCVHDNGQAVFAPHYPKWDERLYSGVNTIGSPSVLAFENKDPLLFDEQFSWVLDIDLYCRLHERYGDPTILNWPDIGIGVGTHQTTHTMSDEEKKDEHSRFFYKHHLV